MQCVVCVCVCVLVCAGVVNKKQGLVPALSLDKKGFYAKGD